MADRIDAGLERLSKEGKTPKLIRVGHELELKLDREINRVYAADLVADGQKAYVIPHNKVTDYKGIRVEVVESAAPDYLEIVT
jgi:hypothetical protein